MAGFEGINLAGCTVGILPALAAAKRKKTEQTEAEKEDTKTEKQ